jgi:hypothetical protein
LVTRFRSWLTRSLIFSSVLPVTSESKDMFYRARSNPSRWWSSNDTMFSNMGVGWYIIR